MAMRHLRIDKIPGTLADVDIGHMQRPDIFLYFTFTNSISYMTEEFSGTSPTDLPPELQNTKIISKQNKLSVHTEIL